MDTGRLGIRGMVAERFPQVVNSVICIEIETKTELIPVLL